VIEQLQAKGAYFRSLLDPIDTTAPQGMLLYGADQLFDITVAYTACVTR